MNKENKIDPRTQFAQRVVQKQIDAPVQHVEVSDNRMTEEPAQQSELIKLRTKANEVQLNVHIDGSLLKRLKLKGISEDKNLKEMIAEAITMYLK